MAPLTLSVDVKSSSATSPGKFSLSVFIIDSVTPFLQFFCVLVCGLIQKVMSLLGSIYIYTPLMMEINVLFLQMFSRG